MKTTILGYLIKFVSLEVPLWHYVSAGIVVLLALTLWGLL